MRNSFAWWLGWLGTIGLVGGFCVSPLTAHADSQFTLAESKVHKLRVLASGGDAWCRPHLSLQMVLDAGSPDAKDPQSLVGLMNRLKEPISAECKSAQTADLALVSDGKTVGTYSASAAGGWVFSPTQSPQAAKASPAGQATAAAKPATSVSPPPSSPQPPTTASATGKTPATSSPPAKPAQVIGADYPGMLVLYLRQNPKLAKDNGVIRWWAWYRYQKEFNQDQNQEFKLQPILDKARLDLAKTIIRSDPGRVVLHYRTQFGSYDFSTQQFPIPMNGTLWAASHPYCCQRGKYPHIFGVKVSGLSSITGMPMDKADAQSFIQRRTFDGGNVNRFVEIAVTVKLGAAWGGAMDSYGRYTVNGTLESVAFLDGKNVISRVTETEVAQMRAEKEAAQAAVAKAAQEKQAAAVRAEQVRQVAAARAAQERWEALQRQQRLAQREQNIRTLASLPVDVRLWNFMTRGSMNSDGHLDDLRAARAAALIRGQPVHVIMLVQTDSSGRDKVATKWPGHLDVSVPAADPELKGSSWYLVDGTLTVPNGDDLPSAQLAGTDIYACSKDQCADAADATAIIDRKQAEFSATKH